jgi:hypothetical protein
MGWRGGTQQEKRLSVGMKDQAGRGKNKDET